MYVVSAEWTEIKCAWSDAVTHSTDDDALSETQRFSKDSELLCDLIGQLPVWHHIYNIMSGKHGNIIDVFDLIRSVFEYLEIIEDLGVFKSSKDFYFGSLTTCQPALIYRWKAAWRENSVTALTW